MSMLAFKFSLHRIALHTNRTPSIHNCRHCYYNIPNSALLHHHLHPSRVHIRYISYCAVYLPSCSNLLSLSLSPYTRHPTSPHSTFFVHCMSYWMHVLIPWPLHSRHRYRSRDTSSWTATLWSGVDRLYEPPLFLFRTKAVVMATRCRRAHVPTLLCYASQGNGIRR